MEPTFISTHTSGVTLAVRVQPRASATAVGDVRNGELRLRVTAPPVDASANDAVVRLLAETLACPRSAIEIIRGAKSRSKIVLVRGQQAAEVAARVSAAQTR